MVEVKQHVWKLKHHACCDHRRHLREWGEVGFKSKGEHNDRKECTAVGGSQRNDGR